MSDPVAPISHPLTLRRPRDGRATAGNPDDYDVMSGDRAIGRIFRSNSAPPDSPWMWTITGAVVMPRAPSTRLRADAGRGQDGICGALAKVARASMTSRLMRVSARRQTRSEPDGATPKTREPRRRVQCGNRGRSRQCSRWHR
jgi:hypothetical protein